MGKLGDQLDVDATIPARFGLCYESRCCAHTVGFGDADEVMEDLPCADVFVREDVVVITKITGPI